MRYVDSIARVERDASMGWWWVEVEDGDARWRDASKSTGVEADTFRREDAANRLARRISGAVGLLASLALLAVSR